jgi:selenocysteine-specific elongation factor
LKRIILGTAGHIDHGKTTLIKAVTGINTDRLKEEQQRGITIELGFASLPLPSGQLLGIVDVPGHERFIKNMVAGATGIDIVVMVIAADEGVMPQTREHLEICELLGIQYGFVVLTKIDMVDEEWLELVMEDVETTVEGTFLENSPIVPVSSVTGEGLDEFIKILDEFCTRVPARTSAGLFRLPIDRVFSMKGFGTVITGTLISGSVSVGDTVMLFPSRISAKVRGLQVHNQSVNTAEAGMRTAINFQGLEKGSVNRGDVLSEPDALNPGYMLDVYLHYLGSNKKPLKNRTRVRFHSGTNEILGLLILLDQEELAPGEKTAAQLRLEYPAALIKEDRFVLRSYSPVRTIGGGIVLNPLPIKHKRFKPQVLEDLKGLRNWSAEDVVLYHCRESGYNGVLFSDLRLMTNVNEKQLTMILQELMSAKKVLLVDRESRLYVHHDTVDDLKLQAQVYLERYHENHPLKPGISREELKSRLPKPMSVKLFNLLLNQMIKDAIIVQEGESVRLKSHKVSLKADQTATRDKLLKIYRDSGLKPPNFSDVVKKIEEASAGVKEVLMHLVSEGHLVKITDELFFDSLAIEKLKKRLVEYLQKHGEINTSGFKDMTGASRKYVIPLMEYFDAKNVTIRVGDIRKLRSG